MFAGIRQPISFIGRYIVKRYDKLGYVKENKKNFYIILVCFCMAAFIGGVACKGLPYMMSRTERFCSTTEMNQQVSSEAYEFAGSGETVEQKIINEYDDIKAIGVKLGTYERMNTGILVLELWDDTCNEIVGISEKDLALIHDNEMAFFNFEDRIPTDASHEYLFKIRAENTDENTRTAVFSTDNGIVYSVKGYYTGCEDKNIFAIAFSGVIFCMLLMAVSIWRRPYFRNIEKTDLMFALIAVALSCFLFSQGDDMCLTIQHAKDLLKLILDGRGGEFYAVVLEKAMNGEYGFANINRAANYNIFLYLAVGVMVAPFILICKIIGVGYTQLAILNYFNLVLAIVLGISVWLIRDICLTMKMKKNRANIVAFLYLSSTMLLFATVGFSQLDLLYILVFLWALKKYLQKKYLQFSVLISISIMLKSFPVLVFVPLILLVEKRILHLIKYFLVGAAGTLIYGLIFRQDVYYTYTQHEMGKIYGFTDRLVESGLDVGLGRMAFFLLIVAVICVWCFEKNVDKEDIWKYVITVPLLIYGAFAIFVSWHPQWLAIFAPFLALAVGVNEKRRSLLYCEWGIGLTYCALSNVIYAKNVDNYMVNYGILPMLTGHTYAGISFGEMAVGNPLISAGFCTAFVALILCLCYFTLKDIRHIDPTSAYGKGSDGVCFQRGCIYARLAVVYALVLSYLVMYFYVG